MYSNPVVDTKPAAQSPGAQADAAARAPVQQQCGAQSKAPVPVYRPRAHTQTPDSWATISSPS
ncbi:MAG TPA: hypothetical protein VH105_17580 [Burkholderiales bacterium]|nr:hypothetical protein [Burkholderiales bacterium]